MEYDLAKLTDKPRGRLLAQTAAENVISPTWVGDLGELTQRSSQRTSSRGSKVVAYSVWWTNGWIEVVEANIAETPGEVTERIRIHDATYALLVTFVTVDGIRVCAPMCWAAYGDSVYTNRLLLAEVLPYFRCMSNDTWRMNLAKVFTHPQDLSNVMALSLSPWFDHGHLSRGGAGPW